ncbi:MAG: bifunctional nicotinamidase/pyrazinamidase [Candidatus Lokiarchaeota archaeon]|nr:bifunctional nicotinamidase/pyrazinamidase [Candidatus Lokiarchaeota archaeon]
MGKKDIKIDDRSALIVIDMQNDFLPGGALPVPDGDAIIDGINEISKLFKEKAIVIYSQDWHPIGHGSFASSYPDKEPGDEIDKQGVGPVLWEDHCVQNTKGAEFHDRMQDEYAICIIRKGYHKEIDSYSAFYDNDHKTSTGLAGILKELKIKNVFICGVALDYCCYFSAIDAKKEGFNVIFIKDLTKAIGNPEGIVEERLESMKKSNIKIVNKKDII